MPNAISRRFWMMGAASLVAYATLPSPAAYALPEVSEIAFDPMIPALANNEGDVTIVEFVDYQCAYCKLCYFEILKLVREDPGIRLVMKDWPIFGQGSELAARGLLAAQDNRVYADAVDGLMRNRRRLTKRRVTDLLDKAGLTSAVLESRLAYGQSGIDQTLARNAAHARAFQLRGTPALLVGNTLYKHALPLEGLRGAVARARAQRDASEG